MPEFRNMLKVAHKEVKKEAGQRQIKAAEESVKKADHPGYESAAMIARGAKSLWKNVSKAVASVEHLCPLDTLVGG